MTVSASQGRACPLAHTGTVCLHSHVLMEFPVLHLCGSSAHWSTSRILVSIQRKQTLMSFLPPAPKTLRLRQAFITEKVAFAIMAFQTELC